MHRLYAGVYRQRWIEGGEGRKEGWVSGWSKEREKTGREDAWRYAGLGRSEIEGGGSEKGERGGEGPVCRVS